MVVPSKKVYHLIKQFEGEIKISSDFKLQCTKRVPIILKVTVLIYVFIYSQYKMNFPVTSTEP